MPESSQPPYIQEVNLEHEKFKFELDQFKEDEALSLVNQSFSEYESFRTNNHDQRWIEHDQLYAGWLPERKWPGTQVKRSSVGIPLVFDQVESALPAVMGALFNNGSDWFEAVAEPGTDPKDAQAIEAALEYSFEHPKGESYGCTMRQEIKLGAKDILLHGNGGVTLYWDAKEDREVIEWVDLRDMYFDPGACTPSVDEMRGVIRRRRMTAQQIKDLSSDPRFNIPSDAQLWSMIQSAAGARADQTKAQSESVRGVNYNAGSSDWLPNPADNKGEVLIYHSKTRVIWVLNRQWVLYNGTNPYNFIPYCFAPCYTWMGRFYAQSVADVNGGNQRVIEGYVNARRDEMALRMHPPRVSNRGSLMTPQEQRYGPGVDMKVDDASKDVQMLYPQNAMTNVFADVEYFERASSSRTGITAMGSGVPTPSNANRTVGGMQMQASGSANRLSEIVQNIEDYMIVPLLYKMYKMKQFHVRPEQTVPARGPGGENYDVPGDVFQKKIGFKMMAASRMLSKDKLLQMVPILSQYLMQGPFVEQLQKTGRTIDFDAYWDILLEATGVKGRYNLVRPMSQEEMQMAQQNSPSAVEAQKVQAEQQTKMGVAQMQSQTQLQVAAMANQPDPAAMAVEQQKLQSEKEKAAVDIQVKQMELALKKELAVLKIQESREKLQVDREKAQFDQQAHRVTTEQNVQAGAMSHQLKLQQMVEQSKVKREEAKKNAAAKPKPAAKAKN